MATYSQNFDCIQASQLREQLVKDLTGEWKFQLSASFNNFQAGKVEQLGGTMTIITINDPFSGISSDIEAKPTWNKKTGVDEKILIARDLTMKTSGIFSSVGEELRMTFLLPIEIGSYVQVVCPINESEKQFSLPLIVEGEALQKDQTIITWKMEFQKVDANRSFKSFSYGSTRSREEQVN